MAGVLDALASYIQNMLMEMAKEELHMLLGVTGEIDNMGLKLRDLKNFLADADRRNITDQSVQAFVRELRGAMYDATDILDLCQLKTMEQDPKHDAGCFNPLQFIVELCQPNDMEEALRCDTTCLNPLLFCIRNPLHAHDIGSRIKSLNKRLDGIKERSASFNFINLDPYEDHGRIVSSGFRTCQTSWGLNETDLVGEIIEEDTRKLVELLIKEDQTNHVYNKIIVFAIVGIGGIGKTTLAKKIFNNDIIQQEFSKKIWLSVNQDFNELDILRRAITEAGGDYHVAGDTKATLERILTQALMGHKTLIIMDDVWDDRAWVDVLRTPLVNVATADNGSRVLVTTRKNKVARGMMAEEPYHRIRKLKPEDAWLLLKKQVVVNEKDEPLVEMLKNIGMRIIEKCDGLPLVIKVMGGLLRQKMFRQGDWKNVMDSMAKTIPSELNQAIYLSYQDLHSSLKCCFLHYSLLPKGTLFFMDDIIGMWISEGFVDATFGDIEDTGREYCSELIQRNLIEPNTRYIEQQVCDMHDVIRSFAWHVARDEALVVHSSDTDISAKLHSQKFTRISLKTKESKSNGLDWSLLQEQTSLRTLVLVGNITFNPGDSLVSFSSLRTLQIDYANFDAVVESLDQLKHLRYLSIRDTDTSILPENIGKMKLLQYISIAKCKHLVKLPASITKLSQLRFLDLGGSGIKNVPQGFSVLTNMRKLSGFPVYTDSDWCSLEELGPLFRLTMLYIKRLQNVSSSSLAIKARLGEKMRLRNLRLEWDSRLDECISEVEQRQTEAVIDELCPPSCLEILEIYQYFGQRLPRWMMSAAIAPLERLRILIMRNLTYCLELPNGLCELPFLEIVQISFARAIKRVGSEILQLSHHSHNEMPVRVAFPSMRELLFIEMTQWQQWEWEEHLKGMPILERLVLQNCKLRRLPAALAIHAKTLRSLVVTSVKCLSSLENFTSIVRLVLFDNPVLERLSNLPKLQELIIRKCLNMKVLEGVPALQRLVLQDYSMKTLPGYLQEVNPRHLLLVCSLSLLTCIAAAKSGPEWVKFSHIQQVKAYANDEGSPRKWHVLYTRVPFVFETNISGSAIDKARVRRMWFRYSETCPTQDERPVGGRRTYADKRVPLCVSLRCNAYRHLVPWLRRACVHCSEAFNVASSSDQWIDAPRYRASTRTILTRHM